VSEKAHSLSIPKMLAMRVSQPNARQGMPDDNVIIGSHFGPRPSCLSLRPLVKLVYAMFGCLLQIGKVGTALTVGYSVTLAVLLSRTLLYPLVRLTGVLFAGSAATVWIVQRLWHVSNPAYPFVEARVQHAARIAAGLALLGVIARRAPALRVPVDIPILNLRVVPGPS
jgi:hypothetical protein